MLTSTEIQKLFYFTRKKRVRFIDVQIELIDHLASSIKELQIENPTLQFEPALAKVYSRYPITGFNNLVQEKTKALYIFWWQKLITYLVSFLNWPKVLWLILSFMGFYVLSSVTSDKVFFGLVLILTLLFLIVGMMNSKIYLNVKTTNFLSLSTYYGICGAFIYFPTQVFIQSQFQGAVVFSGTLQLTICALMSVYVVAVYGLLVVFPKQIKSDIAHKYKDYIQQAA